MTAAPPLTRDACASAGSQFSGDLVVGDADGISVIRFFRAEEIRLLEEERYELHTTPADGTPDHAKRQSQVRNRLYDVPVPQPHR